jgi:hypothetical protein
MTSALTTIKKFYNYQKERFPIVILGISFLPAILSSGAVVAGGVSTEFILLALAVSLAYLLHVRIVDEYRDFDHDLIHHKDRPLSTGKITLKELNYVDWFAILTLLAISALSSLLAFICAVTMLSYSYLARKEFFIGPPLRKHFYLYNAVNLVQMLILQVLVYILASEVFIITNIVIIHFFFTATGTIIFDFLRKVKTPGTDGTGQDTYTWFLGFRNALWVYAVLGTVNILLFVKIQFLIAKPLTSWVLIATVLIVGSLGSWLLHYSKKEEKTNQLMQLMFMGMYGGFNILIFLSI